MIDIQPTIDMQSYSFFSDASKRVFRNLPFGHSEEISKSSFWMLEKNNFLMHIGCGEYQSRAPRVPMHLQIKAAPFGIFGDMIMKHNEKVVNEAMQQLFAFIRLIPAYNNEYCYAISVQYQNGYGAHVDVYPSERWPWFGMSDCDYFRCFCNCTNWNCCIESKHGVPILSLHFHI